MKTCSVCLSHKPLSEFHTDKRRGHSSRCKVCNKAKVNEWRAKNRDSYNASERKKYAENPSKWERHLRSKYGINARDYADLLEHQEGACAICRVKPEQIGQTLAVDHDHATGEVRGLLCAECNRMLGCAKDRPQVLSAGAEYLKNHAEAAHVFVACVMEATC